MQVEHDGYKVVCLYGCCSIFHIALKVADIFLDLMFEDGSQQPAQAFAYDTHRSPVREKDIYTRTIARRIRKVDLSCAFHGSAGYRMPGDLPVLFIPDQPHL